MTLCRETMTNEQRKSVALEYFRALDNGGSTSDGGSLFDLFAVDAEVYFPKWGVAEGRDEIARMFGEVGGIIGAIKHHYATFNWVFSGSDTIVCEGTSHGQAADGTNWRVGEPGWGAGRFCDVFEIRDWAIHRLYIYLDPDYANADSARYPWLA